MRKKKTSRQSIGAEFTAIGISLAQMQVSIEYMRSDINSIDRRLYSLNGCIDSIDKSNQTTYSQLLVVETVLRDVMKLIPGYRQIQMPTYHQMESHLL